MPTAGHVRPTQDAVREALFSILGTSVPNSVFIDLFGGSGAVGIEAWSRGAASVTWLEGNRQVARILRENVASMCGESECRVVEDDIFRWLKHPCPAAETAAATIVFADPPYGDEEEYDRIQEVMELLAASGRMAPGGIFIAEQRAGTPMPSAKGWNRIKDRRYGHTRLTLYSFNGRPADAAGENGLEEETK